MAGKRKTSAATPRKTTAARKKAPSKKKRAVKKAASRSSARAAGNSARTTARPRMKASARPAKVVPAGPVVLDERLVIQGVGELQLMLEAALAGGDAVELDVGRVTSIDTAGLQQLLAFATALRKQGRSLSCVGESQALADSLALAGVGALCPPAHESPAVEDDGLCPVF